MKTFLSDDMVAEAEKMVTLQESRRIAADEAATRVEEAKEAAEQREQAENVLAAAMAGAVVGGGVGVGDGDGGGAVVAGEAASVVAAARAALDAATGAAQAAQERCIVAEETKEACVVAEKAAEQTPFNAMRRALDHERYDRVRAVLGMELRREKGEGRGVDEARGGQ